MHISSAELESKAMAWQGITTDIDGDLRDAVTPDIGADEANLQGMPALTNNTDHNILIYPNPADNHFMITADKPLTGFEVVILDISGKVIFSREVKENNININTKHFTSGYYIILVKGDNEMLHREKIIIR